MAKNKVKYGICNVHYAKATLEDDNTVTYGTPVALPGAKSITISPTSELGKFYADNILYYQTPGSSGYEGTLEIALISDDFCVDILGDQRDEQGGIVEVNLTPGSYFALLFQFEGDTKAVRHCLYYCKANRPELTGETAEETVEPGTESLTIAATARPDNGYVKYRTTVDVDETVYNNWFTEVPTPVFTA